MSFSVRLDSVDRVSFVLACDPAVVETNGALELALYHLDGDAAHLTIPDNAARVTVRPYTPADLRAAARAAGRLPHRGLRVVERKAKAKSIKSAQEQVAMAQAARSAIASEANEVGREDEALSDELAAALEVIEEAREALADVDALWMEALSDDDAAAFRDYYLYKNDEMEALVGICLLDYEEAKGAGTHEIFVEHGPDAMLRALGDMRTSVIAEVWTRLNLLSRLGSEGKARLERGSGFAQPSA